MKIVFYGAVMGLVLAGCQGAGPRTSAILESPNAVAVPAEQNDPFVLIEVNRAVADQVTASGVGRSVTLFLHDQSVEPILIGLGDILEISIVSTSESGFIDFAQTSVSPVSTTTLPLQEVGSDGMVNVPPVGRVEARGLSPQDFETMLARRLGELLVDPSVIVNLVDRRSARVNVLGSVNSPGPYSINQYNTHLVDIITVAGGPTARIEDLRVRIDRDGKVGIVGMDQLFSNSKYNIHVHPGDVVSVETANRRYTLLGAGELNSAFEFDEPELSLADALGRAEGLLNRRADKRGVFLFREMPKAVIQTIGADVGQFPGVTVPTVFQFDLSEPTSIFTLANFEMADGDVIYISDSAVEEVNAVFSAVTTFVPSPGQYILAVQ